GERWSGRRQWRPDAVRGRAHGGPGSLPGQGQRAQLHRHRQDGPKHRHRPAVKDGVEPIGIAKIAKIAKIDNLNVRAGPCGAQSSALSSSERPPSALGFTSGFLRKEKEKPPDQWFS